MTKDKKLQAWERDITNRQRNIVFPDTVLNEGRFYRHLVRNHMKLNPVQRAGVLVVAAIWLASGFFAFVISGASARFDRGGLTGITLLVAFATSLPRIVFGLIVAYNGLTAASAPRPPRWWRERKSRRP